MRIYQAIPLQINTLVELDEAASHHVARVLRAKIKDQIILFNGEGGEYHGFITHISKKNVSVQLTQLHSPTVESPLELCLVQGISRGEKMDFTIQKAVELGVQKIIPLITERCNVQLNADKKEKRWHHWQSIIIHACEQSGRTKLPTLALPKKFSDWLTENELADINLILDPNAATSFKEIITTPPKKIQIIIGPEGGLSSQEVREAAARYFTPIKLGPRILRTETAGMAILSTLQSWYGDLVTNTTSNSIK